MNLLFELFSCTLGWMFGIHLIFSVKSFDKSLLYGMLAGAIVTGLTGLFYPNNRSALIMVLTFLVVFFAFLLPWLIKATTYAFLKSFVRLMLISLICWRILLLSNDEIGFYLCASLLVIEFRYEIDYYQLFNFLQSSKKK